VVGTPGMMQHLPFKIAPHMANAAVRHIPAVIPAEKERRFFRQRGLQLNHIPAGRRMRLLKALHGDRRPASQNQFLRLEREIPVRR